MIHKYNDGTAFIPHHADNEEEIEDESQIVTISLGGTRFIEFKNSKTGSKICQKLCHGDVFTMEKSTQGLFTHSIPLDEESTGEMRLSITLRCISPSKHNIPPHGSISTSCDSLILPVANIPEPASPLGEYNNIVKIPKSQVTQLAATNNLLMANDCGSINPVFQPPESQPPSNTLYISDSIFRRLDESKLSSKAQNAIKLFYPGANASQICHELKNDSKFKDLQGTCVKKVFILAGTNDIDNIYFDREWRIP